MKGKGSPIVIPPMRGSAGYAAWLDRLQDEAGARDRSDLVETALAMLGAAHRVGEPPRRVPPVGTNRHGEPRAKPGEG